MDAYTGLDSVGLYLSGGASNYDPDASLGGQISSHLVQGMIPVISAQIPALVIEDATPENGEGPASISIIGSSATYTPPDGVAGSGVAIAAGERKVLLGADATKAVRVYRESGLLFEGTARFDLRDAINGVLAMGNLADADRIAGSTVYRAIFLKALGDITDLLCWITTDGQSTYSLAAETPDSTDTIQDISDETVAPSGLSWIDADSESGAIDLTDSPGMVAGDVVGLWIRRVFPASGVLAARETASLHVQFDAG